MRIWIIALLALFLVACSPAGDASSGDGGEEKEKTENKQEEEKEEEKTEDTNGEEEQKKEAEETKGMKETEEPIEPQYTLQEDWSFAPINDAEEKVALLTIDDAPDEHAVEMAEKLKEKKAPAIFFVNGHFLDTPEEEEMLKEIHAMGFPIGNHTMTHASLPDLSQEEQREEIVGLSDRIEKIIGERPEFFRAPFGQNTEYSKQLVQEEGMLLMNWTYGYDWNEEYTNAEALSDIMVNTPLLRNGANLLMHDREWTNNALNDIVTGLRDKGYTLLNPEKIERP
ncbi:polysaccharide deacetylase family protein [Salimicrobium halophilum]|uniref:Peptidoglycan/xylan/chitin deacetylase, PgdA/CDA1 family n=1 Tax=Salimicrobium halophilum TaxID=86666 RepID=A0A1G8QI24_9BACI|nr:polysaccharide deacetylase family protein [Salimicrobium halophilum]SDJ04439.1 Peptidoglycan/xylan/chitin deacetylase, PgdA/CDA1 family [Salimicrobium halophilum]